MPRRYVTSAARDPERLVPCPECGVERKEGIGLAVHRKRLHGIEGEAAEREKASRRQDLAEKLAPPKPQPTLEARAAEYRRQQWAALHAGVRQAERARIRPDVHRRFAAVVKRATAAPVRVGAVTYHIGEDYELVEVDISAEARA